MRHLLMAMLVAASVAAPRAQEALTLDQRRTDLTQLADVYAKQYAPYEWKRDVATGFDLYRLTEWLQRVHHADDLDFQEALIEYLASLADAHVGVSFPSTFNASLGFTVDIYDGRVLIDSVNRARLPVAQFPFEVGDELVTLDGVPVQRLIESFRKYAAAPFQRSTDRLAAGLIPSRSQTIMPHAPQLGDAAVAAIRRASSGEVSSYVIPWLKGGLGFESQGPLPSPRRGNGRIFLSPEPDSLAVASGAWPGASRLNDASRAVTDDTLPAYMSPIRPLHNAFVAKANDAILNFGSRVPIYGPPPGFVLRLGSLPSHFFLSGTYVADGVRIGLIRIPSMSPPSASLALQQLDQEMAFFNANTDVLIVDAMRNPGGLISFMESVAQRLIPAPFRTIGFEVRSTANWVAAIASAVTAAEQSGAPPAIVANLRAIFEELLEAYNEERGRSAPVSLNATGSLTLAPAAAAYTRPLLLLVDEFSASAADMLAAIVQDNQRGPLLGMRTTGAGGTVTRMNCTAFTESVCGITISLANRGRLVTGTEFPPTPYIESVGVRPDIVVDVMTRDNLVSAGAPFVQAFTQAAVKLAQPPHP